MASAPSLSCLIPLHRVLIRSQKCVVYGTKLESSEFVKYQTKVCGPTSPTWELGCVLECFWLSSMLLVRMVLTIVLYEADFF